MTDTTPSFLPPGGLLKAASSGFGYLAFAGLSTWASRAVTPRPAARPEGAALPGPGQAGDLPLHGRRAVARR